MGSTEEKDEGDSEASEDMKVSRTDVEGLADGTFDEVESGGMAEGVTEGVTEGVVEGEAEGVVEGVAEGEGVTRVTREIPETT